LDDLKEQLTEAGNNPRKLLNLRKRLARIRVFDPACGSGNFLVIAYKEMRAIEAEINARRGEPERKSEIPLTNFRGIELRHFAVEVARLALIIAEYQCDELYRGQRLALAEFLPLNKENWITHGNALRLDWLKVCPPTGTGGVKLVEDDLFQTPLDQTEIDFENEGGETYVCSNPPYKGRNKKGATEKDDTSFTFSRFSGSFASLDYVANWLFKSAEFCQVNNARAGIVATNSVCQGEQVALLWPRIFSLGIRISFAHVTFKWENLAKRNAGVAVIVIGLDSSKPSQAKLYSNDGVRAVDCIGPYLVPNSETIVKKSETPLHSQRMYLGNMPKDGGFLLMSLEKARQLSTLEKSSVEFIRLFYGSDEVIQSRPRACLWIQDEKVDKARQLEPINYRLEAVKQFRLLSKAESTRRFAATPHRFVQLSAKTGSRAIVIPRVSSEQRDYLPADYFDSNPVIGDKCYAIYDAAIFNFSIIVSKLHLVWIGTVCSRLEMRFSYGNTLGWNTFPIPPLTDDNKADLSRCAEEILLAREAHWPATIAELYDPEKMPADLRAAHDRNDETLERIYIGRRFKNDTERLETLFQLYTEMTAKGKGKK
jgi:hypothetical protein